MQLKLSNKAIFHISKEILVKKKELHLKNNKQFKLCWTVCSIFTVESFYGNDNASISEIKNKCISWYDQTQ